MFIELRVQTDSFRKRLRALAKALTIERTTPLTLPDSSTPLPLPGCDGAEIWLDRIDFWEATLLNMNSDGSLSVQLPIDLFVVDRPTLVESGAAPSAPCWTGTVVAVFRLAPEEVDGVPRLCMSFVRVDPGTNVPQEAADYLSLALAEQAAGLVGACEAVDIAVLDALFDGAPPPITSLALALSAGTTRLGLRIDFDVDSLGVDWLTANSLKAQQTQQKTRFAQAKFQDDDTSKPWTLMVHASLLTSGIRRQLRAGVLAEPSLDLVAGPSAVFMLGMEYKPRIETSVEVQVIDACLCLSAETDLNVEITSTVLLSLPEPDVLETRMEVEFDLDDLEVFCCALTSSVLWPIVGDAILLKNDDFADEYAGGLVAHVFAPFVLAIGVMAMAHSVAEDMITAPDGDWETLAEDDNSIVFRRRWNIALGDFGFGAMAATDLIGASNSVPGIVLSGTLGTAFEQPDAMLDIDPDAEFMIGFDDPCGSEPKAVAEWSFLLKRKASNGTGETPVPLEVFAAGIVDGTDPLNQFAQYFVRKGLSIKFSIPFAKIKASYKSAPYRPQLLIVTSGGVRIIELPKLPILTAEDVAKLEQVQRERQVTSCHDWALADAFWSGGRYNIQWTVDPAPDRVIHQYWEVVVEGLAAAQAVAVDDVAGRHLAVIEPTAKGGLAAYAVLPGGGNSPTGLALAKVAGPGANVGQSVRAVGASAGTSGREGERADRPDNQRLIVRQVELEELTAIPVPSRLRDMALAGARGIVELALADVRGVACWTIARDRATLRRRVARRGIGRVLHWNGAWHTVGDGGLRLVEADRVPQQQCCQGPERDALDADVDGDMLFAVDGSGLWVRQAGLESIERIGGVQGTHIAIHHRTLAVVQVDAVHLWTRPQRGQTRLVGRVELRGATAIRAVRGPGDSYRVSLADGGAVIVSGEGEKARITTRLQATRRTEVVARMADIVALIGPDPHRVLVCRMGGSATLHR